MRVSVSFLLVLFIGSPLFAGLDSVHVKGIPHVKQRPDFCGEACAEMVLRKLGHHIDQDDVFNLSGLNPSLGRGCYTRELGVALKSAGFSVGPIGYRVNATKSDEDLQSLFKQMHADLKRGVTSIVCMHYSDAPKTTEHFRLVVGYDAKTDEVIYHEPAVAKAGDQRMKRLLFLKLWPLKYDAKSWTVIRFAMHAKNVRPVPKSSTYTDADFAQHIMKLKKRLPSKDFNILIEEPFVVVGDESLQRLKSRSKNTIAWAVKRLKAKYFSKDPKQILDIWLFKDKASYEKHCKRLFGFKPHTPYGFYSSTNKALVMNIATGGGTLVHEIVHPFIESNFPRCPSWLNEGLGSLYEQCGERNGQITGFTNWRLAGLQKAIKAGTVPSFKELTSTTRHQFYSKDKGTNYSQARYLCYYLQQKGLLKKYYDQFTKNYRTDPHGYETLKSVLKEKDMDDFKKRWEKYVMGLKYP